MTGGTALQRRYRAAVFIMLATLPWVIWASRKSVEGMRITPEKWAPEDHPERQEFEEFRAQFEGNDVVIVSWDDCTVDDPRLIRFEQQLLSADEETQAIERVVSGATALRRLMDPPLNVPRNEAIARLRGTLVGTNGETSCALVVLTYDGNENRHESIEQIRQTANDTVGDADQVRLAGPPHDGVAIDLESVRGVDIFGTICGLMTTLVCCVCVRSWRLTAVIAATGVYSQGLALALVDLCGLTLDAILIVMPSLVFVLTVSSGIHLVNYFRTALKAESLQADDRSPQMIAEAAAATALRIGWRPCLLATVTTAIGLCSLMVSDIQPVIAFGGLASVTILCAIGLLLLLLPGGMARWPIAVRPDEPGFDRGEHRWSQFAKAVTRCARPIAVTFTVLLITAGFGASRLKTSVDPLALFSESSRLVEDYRWIEDQIGPVVPVEVLVDFGPDCELAFRQRVELVQRIHDRLSEVDNVGGVLSPLTFAPSFDTGSRFRNALAFKRFEANQEQLVKEHLLYDKRESESRGAGSQSWRISGRVPATSGVEYDKLVVEIRKSIAPIIEKEPDAAVSTRVTGMMPLIQTVQETILVDLFQSFLTAFGFVAVAMLFMLKEVRLVGLAMLPNLFPIGVVFGTMGWMGTPIDIGTVMTASVALGIAVDDTVHFLARLTELPEGSCDDTVQMAIRSSGRAMLQTTLICTAGLLVFTASAFVPTQRFGLMMAGLLGTALLGDLVYLPACLTGRRNGVSRPRFALSPGRASSPLAVEQESPQQPGLT